MGPFAIDDEGVISPGQSQRWSNSYEFELSQQAQSRRAADLARQRAADFFQRQEGTYALGLRGNVLASLAQLNELHQYQYTNGVLTPANEDTMEDRATTKNKREKDWLDKLMRTGVPPSSEVSLIMVDDLLEFWAGNLIATLKDNVLKVKKTRGKHLLTQLKKLAKQEGWRVTDLAANVQHHGSSVQVLFLSLKSVQEVDDSALISLTGVDLRGRSGHSESWEWL